MLWDDRAGGSNNVTLIPSNVVTAAGGRFTASWFDTPLLTLDAAAGITNMRFLVDGKLEDQNGVGFAVADDLAWSATSCLVADFNSAEYEVAVRVLTQYYPWRQ
jgi:hypothetical protein